MFSPILLIDCDNGVYELIAGQRRLLAYNFLNEQDSTKFNEIPAFVYEDTMEIWEKKQCLLMKISIKNL